MEEKNKDFDVTKFGEDAVEQISNMKFTSGEKKILDFALALDEEFSDEDYYELAYYFAKNNGLNK